MKSNLLKLLKLYREHFKLLRELDATNLINKLKLLLKML